MSYGIQAYSSIFFTGPVDCKWHEYGRWSKCSVECGSGFQARRRKISTIPRNGGMKCNPKDRVITRPCSRPKCQSDLLLLNSVDCRWGEFGDWSKCSKECGGGIQTRSRSVVQRAKNGGKTCKGQLTQTRGCNSNPCSVDCQWGEFGDWSKCSKECGGGIQTRSRMVIQESEYGGNSCKGQSTQTQQCNLEPCSADCQWGEYGEWSKCTKTCGGGTQFRSRSIARVAEGNGKACKAGDSIQERICNDNPCQVDCQWGEYGEWSKCSQECGGGTQIRTRSVLQEAKNNGKTCKGHPTQTRECNLTPCSVDCQWGEYGEWSECSKDCGGGTQTRSRPIVQEAKNNGKNCKGLPTQTKECNSNPCPIDCQWGEYGEWSKCSKNCGGGTQIRSRPIYREAKFGGKTCKGQPSQTRQCNLMPCSVDCSWGEYGEWSKCTKSCGGGTQTRLRSVAQVAEGNGKTCKGDSVQQRICNDIPCQVDCQWGEFGEWSKCSQDCGVGTQVRSRRVIQEAKNGGKTCFGSKTQTRSCNLHPCPVDCQWGEYGEWTECNKKCGSGVQSRYRFVFAAEMNGGQPCQGSSFETRSCNDQACTEPGMITSRNRKKYQ